MAMPAGLIPILSFIDPIYGRIFKVIEHAAGMWFDQERWLADREARARMAAARRSRKERRRAARKSRQQASRGRRAGKGRG